jgi:hypothetical protein
VGVDSSDAKLAIFVRLGSVGLGISLGGCAREPVAPSISVFGSFFPAWIVCSLLGVVGAAVARIALARAGLEEFLPARLLVYLAFAILIALAIWRLWYGGAPT